MNNIEAESIDDLSIYYNFELSECHVQTICDYLANSTGTIEIHDNAVGCNSKQEVMDSCLITSVNDIQLKESLSIYPNPLKSTTLIQYTLRQNSPVIIKILDLTGQEIITLVNEIQQKGEQHIIFNTGDLSAGIYFCTLKTNSGMQTKKIIKL